MCKDKAQQAFLGPLPLRLSISSLLRIPASVSGDTILPWPACLGGLRLPGQNTADSMDTLETDKPKTKVQTDGVCTGPVFWIAGQGFSWCHVLTWGEGSKLSPESFLICLFLRLNLAM